MGFVSRLLGIRQDKVEREARDAREAETEAKAAWRVELSRGGWRIWMYNPPLPEQYPIQALREGWDLPSQFPTPESVPADMNAFGLYWRPAGTMVDVTPRSVELLVGDARS